MSRGMFASVPAVAELVHRGKVTNTGDELILGENITNEDDEFNDEEHTLVKYDGRKKYRWRSAGSGSTKISLQLLWHLACSLLTTPAVKMPLAVFDGWKGIMIC